MLSKIHTVSISHAVEEEPGRIRAAVLDKGHVVTCFNAQHCKQLHPLAGKAALPPRTILQLLGDTQLTVPMGFPPRMEVNLHQDKQEHQPILNMFYAKYNRHRI